VVQRHKVLIFSGLEAQNNYFQWSRDENIDFQWSRDTKYWF